MMVTAALFPLASAASVAIWFFGSGVPLFSKPVPLTADKTVFYEWAGKTLRHARGSGLPPEVLLELATRFQKSTQADPSLRKFFKSSRVS